MSHDKIHYFSTIFNESARKCEIKREPFAIEQAIRLTHHQPIENPPPLAPHKIKKHEAFSLKPRD